MNHFLFSYYVPANSAKKVQTACFKAGAGTIGNYTECSWHTLGYGQFKAQHGSNPSIGQIGEVFHETTIKVEIICKKDLWQNIEKAFLEAHPYEKPSYFITPILNKI